MNGLAIVLPILAVQPRFEEPAQLGVEASRQLRLFRQQLGERSVERQLEVVLPRRRLVQAGHALAGRARACRRPRLQRFFQPQGRQPVAQHVVALRATQYAIRLLGVARRARHEQADAARILTK